MNYYRLFMILMGAGIALPNLVFLSRFTPPREMPLLSRGLRVKSSALLASGIWVVWQYSRAPRAGAMSSTLEKLVSSALMAYVAFAACFFVFGYFWYRKGGKGSMFKEPLTKEVP